ncbi:type II toxin-antitoxin system RelE family toxin [Spirosoma arcticum]
MYEILITETAEKTLDKLPVQTAERLIKAIYKLAHQPRPPKCVKLSGSENYRIRVGDYRIIYSILDDMLLIEVLKVGNRKDVYK